jgi:hypothetical protein
MQNPPPISNPSYRAISHPSGYEAKSWTAKASGLVLGALLLCCMLLNWPALAQPAPNLAEPLPETKELVRDLFGDEVRLYFSLPDNILVFVDTANGTRRSLTLGDNERNDLLSAYMKACDKATRVKEGEQDEGFAIKMGPTEVTFKMARRDNRSWVVLYVGDAEGSARFAVPQLWEMKDPKILQLIEIKSGFERLLIKSAL